MAFSKFNQKRFNKPIPIKEGETYDVTIENLGEKGDGIAKIEGYVIIVPNTKKGEKIKIKVNAIRGKVSFGEVVERLGEGKDTEDESTEENQDDSDAEDENSDEEEENSKDETPEEEMDSDNEEEETEEATEQIEEEEK